MKKKIIVSLLVCMFALSFATAMNNGQRIHPVDSEIYSAM